jgi:hypothetical protein
MDAILDQKIKEAKTAAGVPDGGLLVVETEIPDAPVAAFRVPTRAVWKRYRAEASSPDPSVKAAAFGPLVYASCVYPPQTELDAAIERYPGLLETFGGELIDHAGANHAKKVSKL